MAKIAENTGFLELRADGVVALTNWKIDCEGEADHRLAIFDAIIVLLQEGRAEIAATEDRSIVVELGNRVSANER